MDAPDAPDDHRVALVSGSAQGIGLAIVEALAAAGFCVAISDVNGDAARDSAARLPGSGRTVMGLELDVTRADHWERAVAAILERWGRLDVLVNNAGLSSRGTVETTEEAVWDRTQAVNVKGPWLGIRASLPALTRSRGVIVNIGSTRATRPLPGLFPYVASKAGLWGLTRQVAVECLERGVTCNMVAPGWVDTPGERVIQAGLGRPDFPNGVVNLIKAEEIGEAVVFLTTPAGRRINGLTLYVDAGLHVADDAGMVYLPGVEHVRYKNI